MNDLLDPRHRYTSSEVAGINEQWLLSQPWVKSVKFVAKSTDPNSPLYYHQVNENLILMRPVVDSKRASIGYPCQTLEEAMAFLNASILPEDMKKKTILIPVIQVRGFRRHITLLRLKPERKSGSSENQIYRATLYDSKKKGRFYGGEVLHRLRILPSLILLGRALSVMTIVLPLAAILQGAKSYQKFKRHKLDNPGARARKDAWERATAKILEEGAPYGTNHIGKAVHRLHGLDKKSKVQLKVRANYVGSQPHRDFNSCGAHVAHRVRHVAEVFAGERMLEVVKKQPPEVELMRSADKTILDTIVDFSEPLPFSYAWWLRRQNSNTHKLVRVNNNEYVQSHVKQYQALVSASAQSLQAVALIQGVANSVKEREDLSVKLTVAASVHDNEQYENIDLTSPNHEGSRAPNTQEFSEMFERRDSNATFVMQQTTFNHGGLSIFTEPRDETGLDVGSDTDTDGILAEKGHEAYVYRHGQICSVTNNR